MRRLHHARSLDPDPVSLEGFDSLILIGDASATTPDAASSLRPFARDVPEPGLGRVEPDARPHDETMMQRAETLARLGRRAEAVMVLRQLLEDQPTHVGARVAIAALLEAGEDPDAALEELTRALGVPSAGVEVLVQRGALYARTGQAARAERDLREAIRRDPSYCPAYRYLGITLLRRGVPADAVTVLREAERLAPDDAEAQLALGEALGAIGRLTEALETLRRAGALAPKDPRPYKLLGRVLDRMGRSDEALAMHRKAREITNP
jgi:Flp pilus assembly protein TadD